MLSAQARRDHTVRSSFQYETAGLPILGQHHVPSSQHKGTRQPRLESTVFTLEIWLRKEENIYTKIQSEHSVAIINGLWANSLGKGGIIPIQTLFYPTNNFLENVLSFFNSVEISQ